MALFHITIEKLIVKSDNEEVCELRARIKELESQMDNWLAVLKQNIAELKIVSDQIDSTK